MDPGSTKGTQPLRIGLTGGIASGKTSVANIFAELGAAIIDTDIIARTVVEPGQPALRQIQQTFGNQVIQADGALDRAALRQLIFSDEQKRLGLESILHPLIQQETVRQTATVASDYQIIVVPLLIESPLRNLMDRILVVDCDESTQIARLLMRDAETEDQAKRILAAQSSRDDRLRIADDVVNNDADLEDTRQQVEKLHEYYTQLSQRGDSPVD